uniref:Uncharacterized protein n=1 Tax=Aplanochytrium stocchinoi TaxID=215587 RepID=A0A7S3PNF3_9STRA|mmetsp:Transcript_7117/g.8571  ORF Transcript_7117/g.8571 Transcript_7117/m.8571 type:complete len:172 (-) Transcript_7117:291-806(-)
MSCAVSGNDDDTVDILRISLFEIQNDRCIFDKVSDWKGDTGQESITSLVKTFYQIAREIDVGEVTSIKFSTQKEATRHGKTRNRAGPPLGVRKELGKQHMYMLCHKGIRYLGVAFARYENGKGKEMVRNMLQILNRRLENVDDQLTQKVIEKELQSSFIEGNINFQEIDLC